MTNQDFIKSLIAVIIVIFAVFGFLCTLSAILNIGFLKAEPNYPSYGLDCAYFINSHNEFGVVCNNYYFYSRP